jgi:hypothetical protein
MSVKGRGVISWQVGGEWEGKGGEGWGKKEGEKVQNKLLKRGTMGLAQEEGEWGGENRDERMMMVKMIV